MEPNTLPQARLLLLADSDVAGAAGNEKGHLFEVFLARLLHEYGYERPTVRNVNVKSDGIELDVATRTRLDRRPAIAECKAYARPVPAKELTNFYGKLTVERFDTPDTLGIMVAVPSLTADGEEKARAITEKDPRFMYLSADDVVERLRQEKLLSEIPAAGLETSDPAVVVTADGTYSSVIQLDDVTRNPARVLVWAASGVVPERTLRLVQTDDYALGLQALDARASASARPDTREVDAEILATVQGSREDFQYQLPAAPRFFVGRRALLAQLDHLVEKGQKTYVLNAQSGWGKSSLALKLAASVAELGGHSLVMDTRTATTPRYVVEVLRRAALEARDANLLTLPQDASWASLSSALRTLETATYADPSRPILVFFDQFENVFRSEPVTRAFRDLALGVQQMTAPLMVGFAWKTDLVGWTEGHPYQLRDEIRSNSEVLLVEPFGPTEVTTLINRLERRAGARLVPDLRARLREYSQGLPWLLKKLADHTVRELKKGATQEQLLAEALNVQNLFEADLAELNPLQREILSHVARYAPVPASEVTDRYPHDAVQSLVDRRLLVQIGDRLDTYWDTFRDFLNTGRVPVEDSYILRQAPNSVARMLPVVMAAGGSATVSEVAAKLQTSDNVVFNLSRELRLMGVTAYEPLRVSIASSILEAADQEGAARRQISQSLKRHKAYSTFRTLAERAGGGVGADAFAHALPLAFPAVSVTESTWNAYARVFLGWFEYAGLATRQGAVWAAWLEGDEPARQRLLFARSAVRARPSVPQEAPRQSLAVLRELAAAGQGDLPAVGTPTRDAVRTLAALGAVSIDAEGLVRIADPGLVHEGDVVPRALRELLRKAPGGQAGLEVLERNPASPPRAVGEAIKAAAGAGWTNSSTASIGGYFRGWAKAAGVTITSPRRGATGE
ncbi:MAG TPA: restriction endonuclease [Propionicimonas sp.]